MTHGRPRGNPSVTTRLLRLALCDTATRCWVWQGYQRRGYGRIMGKTRHDTAHRLSYELFVGPIPAGLTIDHLCHNTLCVNPAHLEAVTLRENIARRDNAGCGWRRNKTHCKRGHAFTASNTTVRIDQKGRLSRNCRECKDMHNRARYRREKAE